MLREFPNMDIKFYKKTPLIREKHGGVLIIRVDVDESRKLAKNSPNSRGCRRYFNQNAAFLTQTPAWS
tara:strand:- start:1074 stop:1277 length:204 start_codon:yes stop_codon:yes gene_type:complete